MYSCSHIFISCTCTGRAVQRRQTDHSCWWRLHTTATEWTIVRRYVEQDSLVVSFLLCCIYNDHISSLFCPAVIVSCSVIGVYKRLSDKRYPYIIMVNSNLSSFPWIFFFDLCIGGVEWWLHMSCAQNIWRFFQFPEQGERPPLFCCVLKGQPLLPFWRN